MTVYRVESPGIVEYFTEDDIREKYWPFWSRRMVDLGRYDQITWDNCLQDFIITHDAWEVNSRT